MAERSWRERLALECDVFTRYLIGEAASSEVSAAYQRAHAASALADDVHPSSRDRAELWVASLGPVWARAADSCAAILARGGLLRRKLVLLVAILESRGRTSRLIDTADPQPLAVWLVRVALGAAASVARAVAAAVVILLLTVAFAVIGGPAKAPGAGRA